MTNTATTPLLASKNNEYPLFYRGAKPIFADAFLKQIRSVSSVLPSARFIINLCEDRYYFALGFCATIASQKTNVLPPSKQHKAIKDIAQSLEDVAILIDSDDFIALPNSIDIRRIQGQQDHPINVNIANSHTAAIAFTSGSTGTPQANLKSWGVLTGTAQRLGMRFITPEQPTTIVATVPSQHMYGLEMTTLMVLQVEGCSLQISHPFYPVDIASAVNTGDTAKLLVTTPLHLRAIAGTELKLPKKLHIVSATAPLSRDIAQAIEQQHASEIYEIYGCTEAGSMATRQTTSSDYWQPLAGVTVSEQSAQAYVSATFLPERYALQDRIELADNGLFILKGRNSDMLNIGGKRASLTDLNNKLLNIAGVDDGYIFIKDSTQQRNQRPQAVFSSQTLSKHDILSKLAEHVDPVFLPRHIYKLPSLPRNERGKIPLAALLDTISKHSD